jgi:aldehyde dehydrogenase (NAD+)
MLIDGELVAATDGAEFDNVSPATGLVLGRTAAAQEHDMDRAIGAARKAFDESDWSTNRALRKRCLEQLQSAIEADKEDLRAELIAEVGCPAMTTQSAQLDWPLAEALMYPARLIDDFEWERRLDGGGLFGDRNVRTVVKEPVGVVGAITPSNFPIEVILNKLGPGLATGNTVVLKPDPNTPWNATRLGRLIAEHTDIPAGVVNVVPTPSNEVAGLLGTDPRVDMISFTGSTAVGKLLMRQGADTMKRMFLELGGKSVSIVLDDANPAAILDAAVGVCVTLGAGVARRPPECSSTGRCSTTRSQISQLHTPRCRSGSRPAGNPCRTGDQRRTEGSRTHTIERAPRRRIDHRRWGEVANLPGHLSGGHYVAPTVIVGVDNSTAIAQQEVFGPVLIVLPFDDTTTRQSALPTTAPTGSRARSCRGPWSAA